ncbi:cell division protein FtsL [Marinobacter sp. JSM 1782161]|uniref:cell division protein FtsL n=1 Tax=Marinobacter sp. JSM 1782161 TaxID=2685906 RepID=UPI001D180FBB|nr:cell division protein FtsL [Marinobacter sp. JSM 1782161]
MAKRTVNTDLKQYRCLYINTDGVYMVRRWAALNARWQLELTEHNQDEFAQKILDLSTPKPADEVMLLSDYLRYWRTEMLGHHQTAKAGSSGASAWPRPSAAPKKAIRLPSRRAATTPRPASS